MVFTATVNVGNITVPKVHATYHFLVTATVLTDGVLNEGDHSEVTEDSTLYVPELGMLNVFCCGFMHDNISDCNLPIHFLKCIFHNVLN